MCSALPWWAWAVFLSFIAGMLALDLGVFHRRSHVVSPREAGVWCGVWLSLALLFNTVVWLWLGHRPALEFLTGYLVEVSLSVDNIFVFILIFSYFKVPAAYQHRVLFWGIIGAIVMRAAFIFAGVSLLQSFHWIIYLFGAFLVYSGVKMALPAREDYDPSANPLVRFAHRYLRIHPAYDGSRFTTVVAGKRAFTPLFLVLLVIESTDLVFALDSIPAVLAITNNSFIVFTSNIFAILGLRSLYFALSGAMQSLRYLAYAHLEFARGHCRDPELCRRALPDAAGRELRCLRLGGRGGSGRSSPKARGLRSVLPSGGLVPRAEGRARARL